jgi:NO-binding membrane sensor protein with MHYT domain
MLAEFFQLGPIPADQMTGVYDLRMVLLSYLVAIFASYIALDITGRLRDIGNTKLSRVLWICGGACAMGAGIWSMHFIGMLAFSMPGMAMGYDSFWTTLSLLVAILGSAFALYLLKAPVINWTQLALGGVVFALAIVTMHYMGMQAMRIQVDIHYLPSLFILSIIIALFASEAALYLALKSNQVVLHLRVRLKVISALIMGAAICGMHYTGMAAAVFTPMVNAMPDALEMNPQIMAVTIATVTFVIMGIAYLVSTYKEALNQQLLEASRQAGMAEVAVSVLHNVGNVLNSLYVSSNIVVEKIKDSKLSEIASLNKMLKEHEKDLGTFITNDSRGAKIPTYINALAEYYKTEKMEMTAEMESVIKNLLHIKEIISVQQDLSKTKSLDQVAAIATLLEEAILLNGFDYSRDNIVIEKKFAKIKPVLVNKIKLMQVLVNLLHNARDALADPAILKKKLTLEVGAVDKNTIFIRIVDNGVGIADKNIKKIFTHGFTTKESGHGFGLHASALTLKNMNGSIKAESPGVGKGATFILTLPYKVPRK